jgi:hypothetical protein
VIIEEQNHGFLSRIVRNSEIESKLEEAKRKLENALKSFQVLANSSDSRHYVLIMDVSGEAINTCHDDHTVHACDGREYIIGKSLL